MALNVSDTKFQAFLCTCPRQWAGDTGFQNWYNDLYNMATGGPTLASVSPNTIVHPGPNTTITLTGTKFLHGAQAFSGATALTTTFKGPTTLSAVLPSTLLTAAGTLSITVQNPDSQASTAVTFTVT